MSFRALASTLGAAIALCALPAAAQPETWYAGLSLGQSRTDDALVANRESTISNATNFRTEFDGTDTAWRLFGGYRFHPNVAVELDYADFGDTRMDTRFTVPTGQTQSGRVLTERKVSGFGVGLAARWPVLEHFALLGRVGWFYAETEATAQLSGDVIFADGTPGTTRTNSVREHRVKFGAGLEWLFSKDASLRLEWERLPDAGTPIEHGVSGRTGEADVDAVSVGIAWRFR